MMMLILMMIIIMMMVIIETKCDVDVDDNNDDDSDHDGREVGMNVNGWYLLSFCFDFFSFGSYSLKMTAGARN